jgi:hypothetical protein
MANHRVSVRAFDATSTRIPQFNLEISTDSGATWQNQTLTDGNAVFAVSEGQPFQVRASRDGLWPVTQEFVARGGPNFELTAVPNLDPAIAYDAAVCTIQGDHLHLVDAYLTLFRDASPDLMAWEQANVTPGGRHLPIPFNPHGIMDFAALPVTSTSGASVLEMAGTERWINGWGPGTGDLFLLHAPPVVSGPRLVAAYVPNCVERSGPLPVVTYYMPNSRWGPAHYPYSSNHLDTLSSYLTGGNRRSLNQVNCARKRVVFFFPLLPSSTLHIPHVGNGSGLREWLFELAYWIRRQPVRTPRVSASLGRCALASFSAGATGLLDVVESGGFQELKELILLDPADHDTSSDTTRARLVSAWQGDGKMLRIYTQYGSWLGAMRNRFSAAPVSGPAGSLEWFSNDESLAYLPQTYWSAAVSHTGGLVAKAFDGRPVNPDSIHQRMPQFFLQHALKNSGFSNA